MWAAMPPTFFMSTNYQLYLGLKVFYCLFKPFF